MVGCCMEVMRQGWRGKEGADLRAWVEADLLACEQRFKVELAYCSKPCTIQRSDCAWHIHVSRISIHIPFLE